VREQDVTKQGFEVVQRLFSEFSTSNTCIYRYYIVALYNLLARHDRSASSWRVHFYNMFDVLVMLRSLVIVKPSFCD
jgi:hypothetical protein